MSGLEAIVAAVPQPPHMKMPDAQWWFTVWLGLPLAVTVAIAIRHIAQGRGPLLLYCVIGGAIASSFEAIVNVLGTMIYAEDGIWTAYSTLDRKIPVLIPLAYAWFVGGQAYLCYRLYARGIDRRSLFGLWVLFAVVDMVIETPGLLADVYKYYGNQPFDFWGFPFWYGWANALMPMIAGALIFKLSPYFDTAWKRLAVIPLLPMADGTAYAAVSWPVWSTLNTSLGYWATYLAALVTLGLALLVVWILSLAVCRVADAKPHKPIPESPQRRGGEIAAARP